MNTAFHRSRPKKLSVKEQYIKSWEFIKESKNFIFVIIGIFFLSTLIGFFIPVPDSLSKLILSYIKDIVKQTSNLSGLELIAFIFFNNLKSSFFGLILGIFFGILPSFIAIFNGYILGFVSFESVKENGIFILWRLLPHGIFELPAVFISLGLGMKLATSLFNKKELRKNFIDALRTFLFVVIPLLIIAAIIEGTLIKLVR